MGFIVRGRSQEHVTGPARMALLFAGLIGGRRELFWQLWLFRHRGRA
jgi:hypothetical protein